MAKNPAEVRAAMDASIEGRTVVDIFARNAREHPSLPAIHWRVGDTWSELTWSEYREA
ncbi:MAG: hypothetical protein HKN95_09070, partial [Acidimicrobiia bacterium]|nr:hypothetical protein [Acidimicrobiia bacterium]